MTDIRRDIAGEELKENRTKFDGFLSKDQDEIDDWIESTVTDLASAKMVLKKLARLTALHAKQIKLR